MHTKIINALKKFSLNLNNKNVLTEAASGNYVVTPIIAALAGANVTAVTRNSKHATVEEVKKQTFSLAKKLNIEDKIRIVETLEDKEYKSFDVITNTGFVRPVDKDIISKVSSKCVLPLMWEPWEFRSEDLDLDACYKRGIKVYGTNESDERLRTMLYIGFIVLYFLLNEKKSPFSSKILLLGNKHFCIPISHVLQSNMYEYTYISEYDQKIDISEFDTIVISENEYDTLLIGDKGFISPKYFTKDKTIIHVCGNVDITHIACKIIPEKPASFGYMSFTTDFIDNQAVIDLHTAGLKVAEGMLSANEKSLAGIEYKRYMEENYCALAFDSKRYW